MFDEFFSKAHELIRQGVPFATAIVVRAEKPTSGKPGDKAIITADGTMHGWIGGSCAQPTVIREALKALRADESRFVRLSPNPLEQVPREGLDDVPMTCFSGGTLEIYIEPQQPQPRLIVIGNLPVARALAQLGQAMSYHTILADPSHTGDPPPYADELLTDLTAIASRVTPLTSIVIATHGQYDELALEQALATSAPYIGLVASRKRAEAVREYLAQQGFSAEQLGRFKSPAGLDIHARRGDEIALGIMAEIVQRRRIGVELAWLPAPAAAGQPEAAPPSPSTPLRAGVGMPPASAIDPVCGMSVTIAGAKHTYEYQGTTFYFCCPGCKTTFRKAPEQYVAAGRILLSS
jgi:xanthine dehydrogenase accessory factor